MFRSLFLRVPLLRSLFVLGLVAIGCASTREGGADCEPGALRCECYANDTCNAALVCLSNRCVESPDEAAGDGGAGASDRDDEATRGDAASPIDESGSDNADDSDPDDSNADDPNADETANGTHSETSDSSLGDESTNEPSSDEGSTSGPSTDDESTDESTDATDSVDDATSDEPTTDGNVEVCLPGEVRCGFGFGEICRAAGDGFDRDPDCNCVAGPEGPQCAATTSGPCSPLDVTCAADGLTLLQCDVNGTQYAPLEDCAQAGQVCVGESCVTLVCTANETWCEDNTLMQCDSAGGVATPLETCSGPYVCSVDAGGCVMHECTSGADRCTADHAALEMCAGGDDAETVSCNCHNDACVVAGRICQPNLQFCDGESIAQCNDVGTLRTLVTPCAGFCQESASGASCVPDACNDGLAACDGESVTLCAEDGSGVLPDATPCGDEEVCDLELGCTDYAHDVLGAPEYIAGVTAMGGYFYRIDTERRLRAVTVTVVAVDEFSTGSIVIYEAANEAGPYELLSQSTIANLSLAPEERTIGKSTLLEAGKYYFIGLWGDMQGLYEPGAEGARTYVSFGEVIAPGHQLFQSQPETFTLEEVQGTHHFHVGIETGRP